MVPDLVVLAVGRFSSLSDVLLLDAELELLSEEPLACLWNSGMPDIHFSYTKKCIGQFLTVTTMLLLYREKALVNT